MSDAFGLRAAVQSDGGFLGDMLAEAANWRASAARPRHEILSSPDHRRYVACWMRPADAGVIAMDVDERAIGAAWFRMLSQDEPGLGFVETAVPELVIGVHPLWRARGVGRALLRALLAEARLRGHRRVSLSVEHDNFARSLYRSEGFVVVASDAGRETMVHRLG